MEFLKLLAYRLGDWSFWRSIVTIESIWCTRIGTVLDKLMWNSLAHACSSFWSSLHKTSNGMSISTRWRAGTSEEIFFINKATSFLALVGTYTVEHEKSYIFSWAWASMWKVVLHRTNENHNNYLDSCNCECLTCRCSESL